MSNAWSLGRMSPPYTISNIYQLSKRGAKLIGVENGGA